MRHPLIPLMLLTVPLLVADSSEAQQPQSPPQISVSADHASGVYDVGERIRWTIDWKADGAAPTNARYTLKLGGLKEVGGGELKFDGKTATVESKIESPNTLLLAIEWDTNDPAHRAFGGAVAAPEKIEPAAPCPDDFDAFWKAKLDESHKLPLNPKLEPGESGKPGVTYSKIALDNIWNTKVRGQVARPEKGEKFPAILVVQWAGVYPLQKAWAVDRAADGWLALNILAHDLPIDNPPDFYKQQYDGPLKNYWMIGNEEREKSYYLRMYLGCSRAIEYLKTRDDWDGKTIVVIGTSQGGQQAVVTAALHPNDVTAVLPFLPAACDMLAPEIGRASGFPNWYVQTWGGRDAKRVHETSRYFDPVNFAHNIKCPVLTGCGLLDDLAPPSSVLAVTNQIKSPKEVIILPNAGHQDEHGSQSAYNQRCYSAWLPALRLGQPPPVAKPSPTATTKQAMNDAAARDHRLMLDALGIKELRRGADADPNSSFAANADETKASLRSPLPDPLAMNDGRPVSSAFMWLTQRRPEIVEMFDREVYGRVPKNVPSVEWEIVSTTNERVGETSVITKQLVGRVGNVAIEMALTTPTATRGRRVPVIMEFSFAGNRSRGDVPEWRHLVLKRGWGYALLNPSSIQADHGAGLTSGIIGLANNGQPRGPEDWGALRAWAWGAGRALDYLETDKDVDAKRVAIEGLSRYGKAALVTMAYDQRFAIGFIASSGAGGAKLLRRNFGEQLESLASTAEYHWFAGNFLKYAGPKAPDDLPVDAHELIALCAPRPVFVSAGAPNVEGNWVDAKGTFLAAVAAGPVYRLLGKTDLGATQMPPIETTLTKGDIAWRQHSAGHTAGPNWPTFLDFASRYFDDGSADQPRARDNDSTWVLKHAELIERARQRTIDVYLVGDSITRRWEATHRQSWDTYFAKRNAADFGAGGDRTQNVLYRLQHGELDDVNPKVIVMMIGTNNVGERVPPGAEKSVVADTSRGIAACLRELRTRAPRAKVVLVGITPRNAADGSTEVMPVINQINARTAALADGHDVRYLDVNDRLATPSGRLFDGMTDDGLHLTDMGYKVWGDALAPILDELLST